MALTHDDLIIKLYYQTSLQNVWLEGRPEEFRTYVDEKLFLADKTLDKFLKQSQVGHKNVKKLI